MQGGGRVGVRPSPLDFGGLEGVAGQRRRATLQLAPRPSFLDFAICL